MITKAKIESILNDGNYATVRIPMYNKASTAVGATHSNHLNSAPIVALPGITPKYQVGDTVYVAFEDDDTSQPVILGNIISAATNSISNIKVHSIEATSDIQMPGKINLGNTEYNEVDINVAIRKLNDALKRIEKLEEQIKKLSK